MVPWYNSTNSLLVNVLQSHLHSQTMQLTDSSYEQPRSKKSGRYIKPLVFSYRKDVLGTEL